jgi:signal transduction histidine kinase/CheY-like chemotaxis protein
VELPSVAALASATLGVYVAAVTGRIARAPGWEDQRWFPAVALTAALAALGTVSLGTGLPDAGLRWAFAGQVALLVLHVAAWIRHAGAALGQPRSRRDRVLAAALSAAGLGMLVPGLGFTGAMVHRVAPRFGFHYAEPVVTPYAAALYAAGLLALAWTFLRFAAAWRRGVARARAPGAGLAAILLLSLHDAAVVAGIGGGVYLLDFGHLLAVGAVGYSLAGRFGREARALAEMRENLSRLVEERTRELAQAHEELHRVEKLGAIGRLAAGVAHEVNNPAAAVAANLTYFAEQLRAGRVPEDADSLLEESRQSVDRIVGIVRQLLDAGRLAAARDVVLVPVSVAGAARAAARLAEARCGSGVAFAVEVPADLWVLAQERPLVQVLTNLAVNGAQAVPAERRDGLVVLSAREREGRVLVQVRDNGTGMSPETLRQVFEPFYTTKPVGRGTGLGLPVSRGIALGLGGQLRLESQPGEGTTAVVDLPAAAHGAQSPEPAPPPLPGGRVLAVDDEADVLAGLGRLLRAHFEVRLAGGVEEALAAARAERFDLVLCDVVMPEGGGLRFHERLRDEAPALAARTIFVTAGAVDEGTRRRLAEHLQPVLEKPIDLAALGRAVRALGAAAPPAPDQSSTGA